MVVELDYSYVDRRAGLDTRCSIFSIASNPCVTSASAGRATTRSCEKLCSVPEAAL